MSLVQIQVSPLNTSQKCGVFLFKTVLNLRFELKNLEVLSKTAILFNISSHLIYNSVKVFFVTRLQIQKTPVQPALHV